MLLFRRHVLLLLLYHLHLSAHNSVSLRLKYHETLKHQYVFFLAVLYLPYIMVLSLELNPNHNQPELHRENFHYPKINLQHLLSSFPYLYIFFIKTFFKLFVFLGGLSFLPFIARNTTAIHHSVLLVSKTIYHQNFFRIKRG